MRYLATFIIAISLTVSSVTLTLSAETEPTSTQIVQKITGTIANEKKQDEPSPPSQSTPIWVYYFTIFNFLWTGGFSIFTWRFNRSASIKDKYWFREILLPSCIKPLQDFAEQQTLKLKSLENGFSGASAKLKRGYKEYLATFKEHKSDVLTKFMILLPIKREIYDDVVGKLDELEDSVALYCAIKTFGAVDEDIKKGVKESHPGQAIYSTLGEILVMISDKHLELYM